MLSNLMTIAIIQ